MIVDQKAVRAGAAPYSKAFLNIYDVWVVHLSNDYAWRCGRDRFLELYSCNVGARHLEVGPGSGYYLANAKFGARAAITLMDLNANSLDHSKRRLAEYEVSTIEGNILEPLPTQLGAFDSIGVNYVLHCVPGAWPEKGVAFSHLARVLADDGVLFGSTILGPGVKRNLFAKALTETYNAVGAFHNRADDYDGLVKALDAAFAHVTVSMVGNVALFTARGPRR